MNNTKKSRLGPAFIYSAIIAGAYILFSIIVDVLEQNFSLVNRIGAWVLLFIGLAYAMYAYRKEYNANVISYSRAFGFGMIVAVILAVILTLYGWIYTNWINPDILEMSRDFAYEKMLERGISESMIEDQMDRLDRFSKPPIVFVIALVQYIILFTIFNLILAAFIRREPVNPFENTEQE